MLSLQFVKPLRIVKVAGDIFFAFAGGQKFVADAYHDLEIEIVNFAFAVVALSSRVVQTSPEIDDRRLEMSFQIIVYLPREVVLTHRDFQKAEFVNSLFRLRFQNRKVVIDLLDEVFCGFVAI